MVGSLQVLVGVQPLSFCADCEIMHVVDPWLFAFLPLSWHSYQMTSSSTSVLHLRFGLQPS